MLRRNLSSYIKRSDALRLALLLLDSVVHSSFREENVSYTFVDVVGCHVTAAVLL